MLKRNAERARAEELRAHRPELERSHHTHTRTHTHTDADADADARVVCDAYADADADAAADDCGVHGWCMAVLSWWVALSG